MSWLLYLKTSFKHQCRKINLQNRYNLYNPRPMKTNYQSHILSYYLMITDRHNSEHHNSLSLVLQESYLTSMSPFSEEFEYLLNWADFNFNFIFILFMLKWKGKFPSILMFFISMSQWSLKHKTKAYTSLQVQGAEIIGVGRFLMTPKGRDLFIFCFNM